MMNMRMGAFEDLYEFVVLICEIGFLYLFLVCEIGDFEMFYELLVG